MASVSAAAALGNPEILPLILKKVHTLRDIVMASGVSRLWRRIAHRSYSALELSKEKLESNELNLLPCIRHFSRLTSLSIVDYKVSEDTPFFLGGLAGAFPKLRELHLSLASGRPPSSPKFLKGLLKAFPLLESFTFSSSGRGLPDPEVLSTLSRIKVLNVRLGANLPETFYDLTTLRELTIIDVATLGVSISPSITRLVNLTKLTTQEVELPTSFGVLPSLEVLELGLMYISYGRFPLPDLRDLPMLSSLTVKGDPLFCINHITPWVPFNLPASLVSFSLTRCPVESISGWCERLPSLQRLELVHFPNLNKIPDSIGKLNSLRTLVIHRCPFLRELPEEIAQLPELQYLSVSGNESLRSIPRALRDSSSLKWLRADDCPNLRLLPWQLAKLIEDSEDVSIGDVNLEFDA